MEKKQVKSKAQRVLVYFIFENEIISIYQKQRLIGHFKIDPTKLDNAKNKCLDKMRNDSTLNSIIYIYTDGEIELEVDVINPKYKFHKDYSK